MVYENIEELNTVENSVEKDLSLSYMLTELKGFERPDEFEGEGKCKICGLEDIGYDIDTVFSSAFTSANRLNPGDIICWRCKELAEFDDFRRYHWILTESGLDITKDRQKILETLMDPPEGRWIVQIVSDFLNKLNGWIVARKLNISSEHFRVVYDKKLVQVEKNQLRRMKEFATVLRDKDIPKRVMLGDVSSSDLDYYDLNFKELERIKKLKDKEVWKLVTKLVK